MAEDIRFSSWRQGFDSPWGYFAIGQKCAYLRVLAVFVSTVVCRDLLCSAHFFQAAAQDKIPEVRQKSQRLLFGFLKGSCVSVEGQSGVTMSRKFLDNLGRCLAVRKERNIAVAQAMKTHLVAVPVHQFKPRCRQALSDKLCRVNPLAEGLRTPYRRRLALHGLSVPSEREPVSGGQVTRLLCCSSPA